MATLEDTHRREFGRTNLPTGSEDNESKWKFFQQMNFLQDTYASRHLTSNIPRPQKGDSSDFTITTNQPDLQTSDMENESLEGDSHTEQAVDESTPSVITHKHATPEKPFKSPKKRHRVKKDPIHDLVELEKVKVARLKGISAHKERIIEEDEDSHIYVPYHNTKNYSPASNYSRS